MRIDLHFDERKLSGSTIYRASGTCISGTYFFQKKEIIFCFWKRNVVHFSKKIVSSEIKRLLLEAWDQLLRTKMHFLLEDYDVFPEDDRLSFPRGDHLPPEERHFFSQEQIHVSHKEILPKMTLFRKKVSLQRNLISIRKIVRMRCTWRVGCVQVD